MEQKETVKYSIIDVESPSYATICNRCGVHVERKNSIQSGMRGVGFDVYCM